jgi:division protein 1
MIQRSVFSFAKANPRELIRSNFNTHEIEHRALTYVPDELLRNIPQTSSPFSLLEGFRASLPEDDAAADKAIRKKRHSRHGSRGQKLLEGVEEERSGPPKVQKLRRDKDRLEHRVDMMGIRKTMCASEIREIDNKIANLNTMRKVILERLAGLEDEERELDTELGEVTERFEALQEQLADEAILAAHTSPVLEPVVEEKDVSDEAESGGFMSESVYEQLPKVKETPPKAKRKKAARRTSHMPVLHEHMEPGSRIRELQAHTDIITALDFDAPFGVAVTAALDDTVRVWDLNAGRCMGMLEGHLSSVRCLQVEESLVATGSMDASIRLWDLSQADYNPQVVTSSNINAKVAEDEDEQLFTEPGSPTPSQSAQPENSGDAMKDCHMFTLSAHVAEITALNFRGSTLVSGSADKTLRQWDLEKGRCVQTLDVLWAAAQAATLNPSASSVSVNTAGSSTTVDAGGWWRPTGGRLQSAESDFIGALQVFETALACGTADGMVRLWDLRSGMVHRSLVGHTGPVTALQFDDVYLVTGSRDRSIRVSCISSRHLTVITMLTYASRYGISGPATSTTLSPTIVLLPACNSTRGESWPRRERTSSRCMTRLTGGSGTAVLVRAQRRMARDRRWWRG